jgi:hypothetical protein
MKKGLGWLQRSILRQTLDLGGYSLVAGLMKHLLGWSEKQGDGAQGFEKNDIGERSYNSGHASMSRALTALRARGLIEIYKNVSGVGTLVALTDAGRTRAKGIFWEGEELE